MSIPVSVHNYLARSGGQYKVRTGQPRKTLRESAAAANIAQHELVQTAVYTDGKVRLMAVFPGTHQADTSVVGKLFKRPFVECPDEELKDLFSDCDPRALPPLGAAYGVKVIVDAAVDRNATVYFPSGRAGVFIRASAADFNGLMEGALRGRRFTTPRLDGQAEESTVQDLQAMFKERIQQVDKLPPMPGMATQILKLRHNPYANISELVAIIEQDPSLSVQLIRYASSPFYGYQGRVDSVAMAVTRVLGMDFVMDLAFGLSLGKSFRNPTGGPLGLDAFWRHATYTASLAQALCNTVEYSRRPSPGVTYLAGLLHNFGFLLLGHLFPEQFARLNKAVAHAPERPIKDVEQEELGISHTELGLWLMETWNMPREIIEAVREHHNPSFRSDFSVYANLVHLANRLLKRFGIGDAEGIDLPPELLEAVGLDELRAEAALGMVMQSRESLEFMARKMAA